MLEAENENGKITCLRTEKILGPVSGRAARVDGIGYAASDL